MKNETKIKIAAVSAGLTVIALPLTLIFTATKHPAQWYAAGALILAFGVALFTICTID